MPLQPCSCVEANVVHTIPDLKLTEEPHTCSNSFDCKPRVSSAAVKQHKYTFQAAMAQSDPCICALSPLIMLSNTQQLCANTAGQGKPAEWPPLCFKGQCGIDSATFHGGHIPWWLGLVAYIPLWLSPLHGSCTSPARGNRHCLPCHCNRWRSGWCS